MSAVKQLKPSFQPWRPVGGMKIRLDHGEVQKIVDAANPAAAIATLIPKAGPYIAAAISLVVWQIQRVDKKHGNRGVVIVVASSLTLGVGLGNYPDVLGPDEW